MTTTRIRCFGTLDGGPSLDAPTFDRLHSDAALLAEDAREIDGIGGTERADDEKLRKLLKDSDHVVNQAKAALALAVETARDHGWSWDRIGKEFGITRQAAIKRFGK